MAVLPSEPDILDLLPTHDSPSVQPHLGSPPPEGQLTAGPDAPRKRRTGRVAGIRAVGHERRGRELDGEVDEMVALRKDARWRGDGWRRWARGVQKIREGCGEEVRGHWSEVVGDGFGRPGLDGVHGGED